MSSDQLLRFCPCLRPPSTVSSSGCYAWVTWPKHTIFRRLIVARGHSCWSTRLFNLALNIMIGFAHPVRGVEELSFVVKRLHPFSASTRNVQVSHPYRRIDMTSDLWNDFVWKMLLLFRILSSLTIAAVTVAIRVWISSARFEYIVWRHLFISRGRGNALACEMVYEDYKFHHSPLGRNDPINTGHWLQEFP